MPRVPVPDDYEDDHILVAGERDYHYPYADVQVDADSARSLQVREDEQGRYCGPPEQFEDAVREYLGVTESSNTESESPGDDSESEPEPVTVVEPEYVEEHIEDGECPWCDDYTGDGVPQHASSAHPEAWAAYKEATE